MFFNTLMDLFQVFKKCKLAFHVFYNDFPKVLQIRKHGSVVLEFFLMKISQSSPYLSAMCLNFNFNLNT